MEDERVLSSTLRDIIWIYHASSELRKEVGSWRFENHQCCTWCELIWKKKKIGSRILLKEHLDIIKSWKGFPGSSAGKESACNAGDSGWIPGLRRSTGKGIGYTLQYSWTSLVAGTEWACNVGDLASIPELGRSPGEVNGNLLPYYNPENSKRGHKELDMVDQLSLSRVEGVSKKNWKKKKDHLSQVCISKAIK